MRKMTQAEFDTLKRNESGYLVIPDGTDCTEIDFGVANKVIFGNWCVLGYECKLGYPTDKDAELQSYAENKRDLCGSVYGFVPVKLVDEVLTKHGGIVGADFSNDGAGFWEGETNDND